MAKNNNQSFRTVLKIRSTGSDTRWKELWRWLLAPPAVKTSQVDVLERFGPKSQAREDAQ